MKKFSYVLVLCTSVFLTNAVTIVYNMRIAEITKRQQLTPNAKQNNIFAQTTFGQWRTLENGFKQSAYGAIATYIKTFKSLYFKIDSAFGHVQNNILTQTFKRTQTDDILFTGGYSHTAGKKSRLTYSGLFGIPTHRDFILELAQFGTGHVGIGGQLDGSYAYSQDRSKVVLTAARLVHFFPRNVSSHNPCLRPLYPCNTYTMNLGNVADLYVVHQFNWVKKNRFECGYDASFIGFGSKVEPSITDFAGSLVYIRHSFFGAYSRRIPLKTKQMGIVTGLAGGFDSRPKTVGNKYMLTAWFLVGVLF